MEVWNISKIFEDAGGPEGVRRHLKDAAKLSAIKAWETRGSIPAIWIAPLITAVDVDARDWIIEDIF